MNKFFIWGFLCLFLTLEAHAQIFTLKVTDYDGLDSVPLVKGLIDQEALKLQNQINEKIPNGAETRIMEGMSNTSVMAGKGTASDYSSNLKFILVGVGVGGAVDLDRPTGTNSDIRGIGITPAVVVGGNLGGMGLSTFGGLDAKRVNTYVNFAKYGITRDVNESVGSNSELKVGMTSAGLRFRYDWIPAKEYVHATWGGLKLHWGYEYNHTHFTFEHDIDKIFAATSGDTNLAGRVTGRPKYEIDVITHSFPFEISTDVRLFKFLSIYGGTAVDFNLGKATGKAKANGNASPVLCTDSGTTCGSGRLFTVQAQAGIDASGRVDPVTGRGFLGIQINVPYVQLYTQVDKGFGTELLGVAVGIRYVH